LALKRIAGRTKILEELTQPNSPVRIMAKWGPNSANSTWAAVKGSTLWQDFASDRLFGFFSVVAESERNIRGELHATPTDRDGQVFDDGLEHAVLTCIDQAVCALCIRP
jgi:hypothetical protein